MKRFAKLSLVTFGFGALGFAMSLVPQKTATGAGSAPVTVINTAAIPVPTTLVGTAAISGSVNVVNTPAVSAQQSGAWSVGIMGTPTVSISGTPSVSLTGGGSVSVANALDGSGNPIPLLTGDVGALHPYTTTCGGLTPMSTNNLGTCSLSAPPAGSRFVVETTTGSCQTPSGNKLFQLGAGILNLQPVFTGPANGDDDYVFNSAQRFYVDSGIPTGQFVFSFGSTDSSGSTACFITLSGYLVNLP